MQYESTFNQIINLIDQLHFQRAEDKHEMSVQISLLQERKKIVINDVVTGKVKVV